jgi:hypothetical protein
MRHVKRDFLALFETLSPKTGFDELNAIYQWIIVSHASGKKLATMKSLMQTFDLDLSIIVHRLAYPLDIYFA